MMELKKDLEMRKVKTKNLIKMNLG